MLAPCCCGAHGPLGSLPASHRPLPRPLCTHRWPRHASPQLDTRHLRRSSLRDGCCCCCCWYWCSVPGSGKARRLLCGCVDMSARCLQVRLMGHAADGTRVSCLTDPAIAMRTPVASIHCSPAAVRPKPVFPENILVPQPCAVLDTQGPPCPCRGEPQATSRRSNHNEQHGRSCQPLRRLNDCCSSPMPCNYSSFDKGAGGRCQSAVFEESV